MILLGQQPAAIGRGHLHDRGRPGGEAFADGAWPGALGGLRFGRRRRGDRVAVEIELEGSVLEGEAHGPVAAADEGEAGEGETLVGRRMTQHRGERLAQAFGVEEGLGGVRGRVGAVDDRLVGLALNEPEALAVGHPVDGAGTPSEKAGIGTDHAALDQGGDRHVAGVHRVAFGVERFLGGGGEWEDRGEEAHQDEGDGDTGHDEMAPWQRNG